MERSHIVNILTHFYLDKDWKRVYSGRWDTWLIVKGYMDEYFYLMLKTDIQVADILREATISARDIENSGLAKALSEEET